MDLTHLLTRTLFVSASGLENAKRLVSSYKQGHVQSMTPELWQAKKIVDSTLHPGIRYYLVWRSYILRMLYRHWTACATALSHVMLRHLQFGGYRWYADSEPHGMPCLVFSLGTLSDLSNQTAGTLAWQVTNQSLNVAINASNANKSTPLSYQTLAQSYLLAVSASCSVALGLNALVPRLKSFKPATKVILGRLVPFAAVASAGAINVFLMRGEEMRVGIDIYRSGVAKGGEEGGKAESLGKSRKAATMAVAETALSRVLNSTPIMVLPPLVLVRLQRTEWLKQRPRMVLPVNLGKSSESLWMRACA